MDPSRLVASWVNPCPNNGRAMNRYPAASLMETDRKEEARNFSYDIRYTLSSKTIVNVFQLRQSRSTGILNERRGFIPLTRCRKSRQSIYSNPTYQDLVPF